MNVFEIGIVASCIDKWRRSGELEANVRQILHTVAVQTGKTVLVDSILDRDIKHAAHAVAFEEKDHDEK